MNPTDSLKPSRYRLARARKIFTRGASVGSVWYTKPFVLSPPENSPSSGVCWGVSRGYLVARYVRIVEVRGSNPLGSTKSKGLNRKVRVLFRSKREALIGRSISRVVYFVLHKVVLKRQKRPSRVKMRAAFCIDLLVRGFHLHGTDQIIRRA